MTSGLPLRLLSRQLQQACRRTFTSLSTRFEAHNFVMPAMSPTMTEGNISSWKVKEGHSFSAGDVLLEIETDKASMDVEAQDNGVMAKIFVQNGSKAVEVGTRIAVLADEGDDISSLEIPRDNAESKSVSEPDKTTKEEQEQEHPQEATADSDPSASEGPKPSFSESESKRDSKATAPSGQGQNKKYPLYPSVIALIHGQHISESEIPKIPATGPQNRLLKGDVLAYLGSIASDYPSQQSKRISNLSHLDLSNIKVMPAPEKPALPTTLQAPAPSMAAPETPAQTTISLPISLSEVLKVQKRIQDTLGVSMPLSTFLSRAVDIANDDLPKPKGAKPSSDDLFNAVLGLDTISSTSRGAYIPQITALPSPLSMPAVTTNRKEKIRKPDIIDILSGKITPTTRTPKIGPLTAGIVTSAARSGGATNVFTITVTAGEEKRARTFLERMKTVLQVEPGRLIL